MGEILIGKRTPGSTSHGYRWSEPDEVVAVPHEHARELLAIKDADFFHAGEPEPSGEASIFSEVDDDEDDVTEPEGPDLARALAEARPARRSRTAPGSDK